MAGSCSMGMMEIFLRHFARASATQDMAKMLQSKNVRQYFVLGTSALTQKRRPTPSSCHPATDIQVYFSLKPPKVQQKSWPTWKLPKIGVTPRIIQHRTI